MISEVASKVTYSGNGSANLFDFSFELLKSAALKVMLTDPTGIETILSSGYSVDVNNKKVRYPTVESGLALLPTGWKITLYRNVSLSQDYSLSNQDGLYLKTIEAALDKQMMATQQLAEAISRAVKVSISSATNPDQLIADLQTAAAAAVAAGVIAQQAIALIGGIAPIQSGDAGKAVLVNQTENGFILDAIATSFRSLTDAPDSFAGFAKKGVRVNAAENALEFANSASNLVLIGHSNSYTCTADTSYAALLDMRFILDPMRTQKVLKFAVVEKGNGNCRITVTDGTTSVNVVGANGNSASYAVRELELDCSTLASNILWTVTVEGQAVSGEYEVRRFSCQADPAYNLGCYPLILSDPGVAMNSATPTVVDTKYFPVNWAIDNQCVVHAQGLLTLNSGTTATIKVRLTTTKDAETTFEEMSQTLTATGYFDLLIDFPSIVAPYVKTEVFLSTDGVVTLEHVSLWLEI